jgi:hypothetical protein
MARAWVGLLLLLSPAAGDGDRVELAGEPVDVGPRLPSQRLDLVAFHPVGHAIRLGSGTFPVEVRETGVRLATRSEADPGKFLRGDATVKLGSTRVHLRRAASGWEYAIATGRQFEVEGVIFRLVDVSADGRFTVGEDGWQLVPSEFVLPLVPSLVLGRVRLGITRLAEDGSAIEGRVAPLAGSRMQLDGLVAVNDLRTRAGLPPTVVDPALSAACSAHAAYLRLHKWTPYRFNPHFEVKEWRGYSQEGNRAGMMSVIAWCAHGPAVEGHWLTYYHRFAFLHPALDGIGINDETPSISVIDAKSAADGTGGALGGWKDPILWPCDGATGVPTAFHGAGEIPSPVDDAGTRGYPLTVLFLAEDPGVTGFRGVLERVTRKGIERVGTLEPRSQGDGSRFGLIPEQPLRSGQTYRVTYALERRGAPETLVATFETR